MVAVRRDHTVRGADGLTHAGKHGFLSNVQVAKATEFLLDVQLAAAFLELSHEVHFAKPARVCVFVQALCRLLGSGLTSSFCGLLGAAVAVGCEVAIAFGLTFKYSVPPHPFAGQGWGHALAHIVYKYTILHLSSNQRAPRNEPLHARCTFTAAPRAPHQTCDLSPQLHQLLQSRSPLGLEAIDAVALMDRFDSKYVVPVSWLENLVQELDEHSVLSIQDHVSTVYNNLYFDTPEGTCLEDHTRGKNIRYKVRVRQYANTGWLFWR